MTSLGQVDDASDARKASPSNCSSPSKPPQQEMPVVRKTAKGPSEPGTTSIQIFMTIYK